MLDDRNLIFIKKQGKSKTVHISDKGKLLLNGREVV
jgi:predicted transcriptional regulator